MDSSHQLYRAKQAAWNFQKALLSKEIHMAEAQAKWEHERARFTEENMSQRKQIAALQDEVAKLELQVAIEKQSTCSHLGDLMAGELNPSDQQHRYCDEHDLGLNLTKILKPPLDPEALSSLIEDELCLLRHYVNESNSEDETNNPTFFERASENKSGRQQQNFRDSEDQHFQNDSIALLCNKVCELEEEISSKNTEISVLCEKMQEYADGFVCLDENEQMLAQKDKDIAALSLQLRDVSQKYTQLLVNRKGSPNSGADSPNESTNPEVTKSFLREAGKNLQMTSAAIHRDNKTCVGEAGCLQQPKLQISPPPKALSDPLPQEEACQHVRQQQFQRDRSQSVPTNSTLARLMSKAQAATTARRHSLPPAPADAFPRAAEGPEEGVVAAAAAAAAAEQQQQREARQREERRLWARAQEERVAAARAGEAQAAAREGRARQAHAALLREHARARRELALLQQVLRLRERGSPRGGGAGAGGSPRGGSRSPRAGDSRLALLNDTLFEAEMDDVMYY